MTIHRVHIILDDDDWRMLSEMAGVAKLNLLAGDDDPRHPGRGHRSHFIRRLIRKEYKGFNKTDEFLRREGILK